MAFFKQRPLLIVILPLFILTAAASFHRFVIETDYLVNYEGPCDPETDSCYVDCVDEECSEEYYYTVIERHANEIFALCGPDITDCAAAETCPIDEPTCSIRYCDPATETAFCDPINPGSL